MAKQPKEVLNNIKIVMVETSHPGNIGAAARALKTMGLSQLCLVAPQQFPHDKAVWRAAGAADIIENVEVCDSFQEAIADCVLVIGASARQRRIPWPLMNPKESAKLSLEAASKGSVALVFGREDRGLTNEELQLCNYHVTIPGNEEYSVLNIAAAVQVVCYELRMAYESLSDASEVSTDKLMSHWDESPAAQAQVEHFYEHLEKVLVDLDFHDRENPRQLMTRLRRLFNRTHLDKMELNILRGILSAIEKRL